MQTWGESNGSEGWQFIRTGGEHKWREMAVGHRGCCLDPNVTASKDTLVWEPRTLCRPAAGLRKAGIKVYNPQPWLTGALGGTGQRTAVPPANG